MKTCLGIAHHTMLAGLVLAAVAMAWAQSPAKHQTPRKDSASSAPAANAASGAKLFKLQCAVCHYDKSTAQKIGPGLRGLAQRGKFADGKTVTDESLRAWIEKGGKNMPGFKETLKPDEIRDLVAFLRTL